MTFKDVQRHSYTHNPLEEVICQLQFPTLLKVRNQDPVAYQERIQNLFPSLEEREVKQISIVYGETVGSSEKTQRFYEFSTKDNNWKVTISSDFITLATRKYSNWEEFRGYAVEVFNPFVEIYKPQICKRLGLRYRNAINRHDLKIEAKGWNELINPLLAGCFSTGEINSEDIKEYKGQFTLDLKNLGYLTVNYGIGLNPENNQTAFILDSDFFSTDDQTFTADLAGIYARLDGFKEEAHRVFRWAITDELHRIMGPTTPRT